MSSELKINLGCGYIGHPDWINVDYGVLAFINKFPFLKRLVFALKLAPLEYNIPWPENLRLIDLRKSFPFKEKTISYIFTAHFLEHLYKFEADKLFKKCYHGLKPGGMIRILVPDLDIVVRQYRESTDPIEKVEIINRHFWGFRMGMESPSLYQKIMNFFIRGHRWLYNFDYLRQSLIKAGFEPGKIVRCGYQRGRVPNIDILDNFPDHSLFVEATK